MIFTLKRDKLEKSVHIWLCRSALAVVDLVLMLATVQCVLMYQTYTAAEFANSLYPVLSDCV